MLRRARFDVERASGERGRGASGNRAARGEKRRLFSPGVVAKPK